MRVSKDTKKDKLGALSCEANKWNFYLLLNPEREPIPRFWRSSLVKDTCTAPSFQLYEEDVCPAPNLWGKIFDPTQNPSPKRLEEAAIHLQLKLVKALWCPNSSESGRPRKEGEKGGKRKKREIDLKKMKWSEGSLLGPQYPVPHLGGPIFNPFRSKMSSAHQNHSKIPVTVSKKRDWNPSPKTFVWYKTKEKMSNLNFWTTMVWSLHGVCRQSGFKSRCNRNLNRIPGSFTTKFNQAFTKYQAKFL